MKLTLDPCDSLTGWSFSGGASAVLNQHTEFVADGLSSSILIHVPAGSTGALASKALDVDVSGYGEVTLSVWSRNFGGEHGLDPSGYHYSLAFEGTREYLLPLPSSFEAVSFGADWGKASKIEVKALTDDEDWLVISACYAVRDDHPLDIFQAVRGALRLSLDSLQPLGLPLGKVSCTAGDALLTLGAFDYVDRYCAVFVDDGDSSELHQVDRWDQPDAYFGQAYDGPLAKYDHDGADAYLYFPVEFGTDEKEAIVPGIAVYGTAEDDATVSDDVAALVDSLCVDGTAAVRRTPWALRYRVFVDCEARHPYVLALLSRAARRWIASGRLWVNGRRHDVLYHESAQFVEPDEPENLVPKKQYEVQIVIYEEREDRVWMPATKARNFTFEPGVV